MIATWQAPLPDDQSSEELLVAYDEARERRILIIPALFDEANKMRRQTMLLMRRLDQAGCDSFLLDLPGCNESLIPLAEQSLTSWRNAVKSAAKQCSATHIFAIRAGTLLSPLDLPGWQYAAQSGPKLLRSMIRARVLASREAGRDENSEHLLDVGRSEGLMLAGWPIGATLFAELERAEPALGEHQEAIAQTDIDGAGLWLRAEAGENSAQVEALSAIVSGQAEGAS